MLSYLRQTLKESLPHHQMLPSQSVLQKRHRRLHILLPDGDRIYMIGHVRTVLRAVIISHVYRTTSAASDRHIAVQDIRLCRISFFLKQPESFLIFFLVMCAVNRFSCQKIKHPDPPFCPVLFPAAARSRFSVYINDTRISERYACAQSNFTENLPYQYRKNEAAHRKVFIHTLPASASSIISNAYPTIVSTTCSGVMPMIPPSCRWARTTGRISSRRNPTPCSCFSSA